MRKASEVIAYFKDDIASVSTNPIRDLRLLLGFVLDVEADKIFFHPELPVSKDQLAHFKELLARARNHEPLSKIMGRKEFYSRNFITSADVLDPRPDTEILIDLAKKYAPTLPQPLNILDLGVGSGCILVTLMLELGAFMDETKISGTGVDLSEAALKIAQKNCDQFSLHERICLIQSDWFSNIPMDATFSLIVANPPYIEKECPLDPNVWKFDPHLALFGGHDGLECYRAIALKVRSFLKDGGLFMCEFGKGQRDAITEIFEKNDMIFKQCVADFSGTDRVAIFA